MSRHAIEQHQSDPKMQAHYRFQLHALRYVSVMLALWCLPLITTHADAVLDRHAPPGTIVDIGDELRVHIYCVGNGGTTVILDAGVGANYLDWHHVQRHKRLRQNKRLKVCSYDRAGYGWSSAGPRPRTSDTIVNELWAVIASTGLTGPFILVGHSFGGLNMMYFAGRYRENVAGLVLVDAVSPNQFRRFTAESIDIPTANSRRFLLADKRKITRGLPRRMKNIAFALARRESAMAATYNEVRNMPVSADLVAELPDLDSRLIVISHGETIWRNQAMVGSLESVWHELQLELVSVSTQSEHVVSSASGHEITIDDPAIIVDAINDIANQTHYSSQ